MPRGRKEWDPIAERERLDGMWEFERKAAEQGFRCIAGLDEAGRGPWAGPVAAAAVVLPPDFYLPGVDDSKKLSDKKRTELARDIQKLALDWSVALVAPGKIDEINILEATRLAMTRAVETLVQQPDYLLLDAIRLPKVALPQEDIIKGDQKSISIACASILAKVTRDRVMEQYDVLYPGYGFVKHKGYGTKQHQEALKKWGVSPIHRRSYRPVREILEG